MRLRMLLFCVSLLALAPRAEAAPITIAFGGSFDSVSSPMAVLFPGLTVGTDFWGFITVADEPISPTSGLYKTDVEVSFLTYTITTTAPHADPLTTGFVSWAAVPQSNHVGVGFIDTLYIDWETSTSSLGGMRFNGTAVNNAPAYDGAAGGDFRVMARVPEPATWLLSAIGLAALKGRKRHR